MLDTPLFRTIVDNIEEGVYYVDPERTILLWNKGAEKITGYAASEVLGRHCQDDILNHIDHEGHPLCLMCCPLYATMGDGQQRKAEVLLRHKKGYRVPVRVNAIPIYEGDAVVGALEVFSPTSPVQYEDSFVQSLTSRAMRDQLTGLPNRAYLESFLHYKLQEFRRFGSLFCVLFADIDNFSRVNNEYGHTAGDNVLCGIAAALTEHLRKADKVGRWGGEEFLGVFDLRAEEDIHIMGEKVRSILDIAHTMPDGTPRRVTCSLGITAVRPGDTADAILQRADTLMYKSKQSGKNCVSTDAVAPDGTH